MAKPSTLQAAFLGILIVLALSGCPSSGGAPPYSNHLVNESSPYLLQHAHNPVDWNPWGDAALSKARDEDKMLIISIGYAACHWCHVMERESFEDTAVARIMNEHFVSIKVDREERPDIDDVYMTACQLASGGACGWPLNAFALPDGRPVWAGTYFPRKQWIEILEYFVALKEKDRQKLENYANQLRDGVARHDLQEIGEEEQPVIPATTERMAAMIVEETDWQWGGRRGSPKFPMPAVYEFLLQQHYYNGHRQALEAVIVTLDRMARGGIYDQLGGGFARYATDEQWLVPHFEKMLYDNGQLVSLYAHAYQVTGNSSYRRVIEETLAFIERELTAPNGGFFSSLDADSEGEEGKYYVWSRNEVDSLLEGPPLSAFIADYFDVSENGNWEEGKNILHTNQPLANVAGQFSLDTTQARQLLDEGRRRLFTVRQQRPRPRTDDKILTAWNALMLTGYVDAYRALKNESYLEAAVRNASFLKAHLVKEDFRLDRNFKNGHSTINAFLDDYALTARALIALYQITFDEEWLYTARGIADYALEHFYDDSSGLFFYTSDLDPPLVARKLETGDNVIPGSNSTMARVLYDLSLYFYEDHYRETARTMITRILATMEKTSDPAFFANWAMLANDLIHAPLEVAIVGPAFAEKLQELGAAYLPGVRLLGGSDEGTLELLKNKAQDERTIIYVCQEKVCKLPVEEVTAALELIRK